MKEIRILTSTAHRNCISAILQFMYCSSQISFDMEKIAYSSAIYTDSHKMIEAVLINTVMYSEQGAPSI